MRGTRPARAGYLRLCRFIPAHAGNSCKSPSRFAVSAVHPRACGELSAPASPFSTATGSSPRMRGTHSLLAFEGLRRRFIPAHAGNSPGTQRVFRLKSVHPRACGELALPEIILLSVAGSSPRMRGTHGGQPHHPRLQRFIPAHAGNSAPHPSRRCPPAVHPRACGELDRRGRACYDDDGSSPRMRGTRGCLLIGSLELRFIPAHAGNSSLRTSGWNVEPVHPRACGELGSGVKPVQFSIGSSPRMRGTPFRCPALESG